MSIEVGVWSGIVEANKPLALDPAAPIRITNVALGHELQDANARTTLNLIYKTLIPPDDEDDDEDEQSEQPLSATVLCSLTPGKIEHVTLNIVLEEKEEYVLDIEGPNTVHLTGNYIDLKPTDMSPYGSEMDSDEDAFDLGEVSSDVEMDPNDLDDSARFEEIDEAIHGSPKNLKRGRDSDAGEAVKAAKKQKGQDGKAAKPESEGAAGGDKKEKKEKKEKKKDADGKTEKQAPKEREVAGGIKIKDTKIGTGPAVKKGASVSMRYIGKLNNASGKQFDQNTKGKPFSFRLGGGEVIKGWDEGIVGMQVGGERILTIPPAMGYGKKGTDGIPGNSTLHFEVKLVSFK